MSSSINEKRDAFKQSLKVDVSDVQTSSAKKAQFSSNNNDSDNNSNSNSADGPTRGESHSRGQGIER